MREELTRCAAVTWEWGKASCKVRRSILHVRSPAAHPSENHVASTRLSRNIEVFRAAERSSSATAHHPSTAPAARRLTVKSLLCTAAAPALDACQAVEQPYGDPPRLTGKKGVSVDSCLQGCSLG